MESNVTLAVPEATTYGNGAPRPARSQAISEEMRRISETIERLHAKVVQAEDMLDTVLTPVAEADPVPGSVPVPSVSLHATRLRDFADQIDTLVNRLDRLTARVEL